MAPKRAAKGKQPATSSTPMAPSTEADVVFRTAEQRQRFQALQGRRIVHTRYADSSALQRLGLLDDVRWMFHRIGWEQFFESCFPTFPLLVTEFLSSLSLNVNIHDEDDPGRLEFRLGNADHRLSLEELNNIFGFPPSAPRCMPAEFHDSTFWRQITSERAYSSKDARSAPVTNPCLKYAHRVLSNTIFGRGESESTVRRSELFVLWAMLHGHIFNSAFFLVKQLDKVARAQKGAIVLGGLVTPIALALGMEPYRMERAPGHNKIDIESCVAMRMIAREGGMLRLILPRGLILYLPNTARTSVQDRQNWNITSVVDFDDGEQPPPLATEAPAGPSLSGQHPHTTTDRIIRASYSEILQIRRSQARIFTKVNDIANFLHDHFNYPSTDEPGATDDSDASGDT